MKRATSKAHAARRASRRLEARDRGSWMMFHKNNIRRSLCTWCLSLTEGFRTGSFNLR